MVTCISGIPGSGKNVRATYLAKKHYKKSNSPIRKVIRKIMHKPTHINNIYSTYPILLKKGTKKRKAIYSNRVTIYDLIPDNRFEENALIIIDEVQAFWDSDEYKEFPKKIATFNQFHRHFGISDIYYISQHPSRIVKKLCNIACEFDKIKTFVNIPLINIAFMHVISYFERDDYGKYNHPKREIKTYDVKNHYILFLTGKIFKSYDSKYLKVLNKDKPLFNSGTFDNLSLSEAEIKYIYRNSF